MNFTKARCDSSPPRHGPAPRPAVKPPPRATQSAKPSPRTSAASPNPRAPPRLQRNPPTHRYAPARRASQRLLPSRNAKRANCILPYSWPFQSCASGGNRTRTTLSGQGILSPSCLPFHHQGKAIAPQPLRQSHCAAASVSARWNADWSQIYKLIADVCKIILND